ncbi:MAG: hypothetical protein ACR2PZ_21560 [Pseudomonadales bacterium]
MLEYQNQSSQLTLREGHAEYCSAFEQFLKSRALSAEAKEFFRCHDIVHVVFGCDLSLDHEAVVKISSFFGTTAGLSVLSGYRLPESKEIYGEIGVVDVALTTMKSLILVPKTLWRCSRMHKRWPWSEFDDCLDRPLKDIREEFGINVVLKRR